MIDSESGTGRREDVAIDSGSRVGWTEDGIIDSETDTGTCWVEAGVMDS